MKEGQTRSRRCSERDISDLFVFAQLHRGQRRKYANSLTSNRDAGPTRFFRQAYRSASEIIVDVSRRSRGISSAAARDDDFA